MRAGIVGGHAWGMLLGVAALALPAGARAAGEERGVPALVIHDTATPPEERLLALSFPEPAPGSTEAPAPSASVVSAPVDDPAPIDSPSPPPRGASRGPFFGASAAL